MLYTIVLILVGALIFVGVSAAILAYLNKCSHDFELVERIYSEPKLIIYGSQTGDDRDRARYGYTTLVFKCCKCHKLRKIGALGKSCHAK